MRCGVRIGGAVSSPVKEMLIVTSDRFRFLVGFMLVLDLSSQFSSLFTPSYFVELRCSDRKRDRAADKAAHPPCELELLHLPKKNPAVSV